MVKKGKRSEHVSASMRNFRGVKTIETLREEIDRMRDNMIRDFSHALKTPIAISQMACDMVEDGIKKGDMGQIKKAVGIIKRSIEKARNDTDKILYMSGLIRRDRTLTRVPVSLKRMINDIVNVSRNIIDEKKLKVEVNIEENADMLTMDMHDLGMLLGNIIDNALKFTDAGKVSISGKLNKGVVDIELKDTGCGISPDIKERVFDKFYKRHTALPGVGLGLSISKDIVERYQGRIEIESAGAGKGTTVTISLPKA